jgi:hypothetical protein
MEQQCYAHAENASSDDVGLLPPPAAQNNKRGLRVAFGATVVVAIAIASVMTFRHHKLRGEPVHPQGRATALEQITPLKPRKWCSSATENCIETGCCKVSGAKCFKKTEKFAGCKMNCTGSDWSCEEVKNLKWTMEADSPAASLYCYVVHFENNNGKPNKELEMMPVQMGKGLHIYACDAWDIFSDISFNVGSYPSVVVEDVDGDFCKYDRPDTGACANTAIYYQVWMKLKSMDTWKDQEWVIKTDVDAVFIPQRLKDMLALQTQPAVGIYYENCKGVDSGFFGALEVVSNKAFTIALRELEDCKSTLCWGGEKCDDWKYGPWGEDKFLQECMDKHYVAKMPFYELTNDGACPGDRPKGDKKNKKFKPVCADSTAPATHPFKTLDAWMSCYEDTMKSV